MARDQSKVWSNFRAKRKPNMHNNRVGAQM